MRQYDTELSFVCNILDKKRIPYRFVNSKDRFEDVFDGNVISLFASALEKIETISDMFPQLQSNVIYKMTSAYRFCYIYMLLPNRSENNVFLVGPYLPALLSDNEILEIGEQLGLSPKVQAIFKQYLNNVPIVADSSYVYVILNTLGDIMWGRSSFSVIDVISERQAPVSPINYLHDKDSDTALINMKIMEERYAFENEMMNAVSRGQVHKASQLMASFSEMTFEKRTTDPIRNMKNYSIIMNTLLRKAAESGGVHPIYLDSVSSSYAKKIEEFSSLSEIQALMSDMFKSYCRLVRRHSMGDYSPTVQKAIVFIESDLSADLTLSTVANEQKISSGYLSAVFKKETGRTITEYIREKRIRHAIYLLETTHLQIQTIAIHCGIVDLQYFSKIFKKHTGKTPKEYRESIRNY